MAEHWLYAPSMGFFLILAKGFSVLYRKRGFRIVSLLSIAGLLAFYSFLTTRQNEYWKDPIALYERTIKYSPESSRVYIWLSNAYHDAGRDEEAVAILKKAIEVDPNCVKAYNTLGFAYTALGEPKEAIAQFKKAIAINPNYALAHKNLAWVYYDSGEYKLAIKHCDTALRLGYKVDQALLKNLEPYQK